MSYNDWSAEVYCNGARCLDRENVYIYTGITVFLTLDASFSTMTKNLWSVKYHAVLGDDHIRLCAYRTHPELWRWDGNEAKQISLVPYTVSDEGDYVGKIDDYQFVIIPLSPEEISLLLVEPNGTKWTATSGRVRI